MPGGIEIPGILGGVFGEISEEYLEEFPKECLEEIQKGDYEKLLANCLHARVSGHKREYVVDWHLSRKRDGFVKKECSRCGFGATRRFESTGREFMAQTLLLAKQLRPRAAWGYYAFPYCFNMNGGSTSNGQKEDCSAEVQRENDRIQWLFDDSDIIFPSVYLREKLGAGDRIKLIRGRVKEAVRMARRANVQPKPRVLTYIRYVYTDSIKYLTEVSFRYGLW
ncbi:hypothetical protein RP20_CCG017190 [Aedes albopictus]|nr:hypothetical protein RP20_CCG017190 [Aedes albopictus]